MIGASSSMYSVMQRPSPQEMFAKMDTDSSEGLSADEIEGTRLADAVGDNFSGVDTDGNGELSHDELEALRETLEANKSSDGNQSGDRPPPPPPPPPSEGGGGLQMSLLLALMELDAEESDETTATDILSSVTATSDTEEENTASDLIDEILLDQETV